MLYSKQAEYAIQIMLYLAEHAGDRGSSIADIKAGCYIPEEHFDHIVDELVSTGLATKLSGSGHTLALAHPGSSIALEDIVECFDGPPTTANCVIGLDVCSDENPCPLHFEWTHARSLIRDTLITKNLAELVNGLQARQKEMGQAES